MTDFTLKEKQMTDFTRLKTLAGLCEADRWSHNKIAIEAERALLNVFKHFEAAKGIDKLTLLEAMTDMFEPSTFQALPSLLKFARTLAASIELDLQDEQDQTVKKGFFKLVAKYRF